MKSKSIKNSKLKIQINKTKKRNYNATQQKSNQKQNNQTNNPVQNEPKYIPDSKFHSSTETLMATHLNEASFSLQ